MVAELPVEDAEAFCEWMLTDFEWNNQTVMMAPAAGFYRSPGAGKNQVRIAYVLNETDLEQAMECLARGIAAYNRLKA
jgi:aspartate aminotransferase